MGEPVLRFKDSNNSNYPDSIAVTLETFCKFQQGVQVDLGLQVNTNTDGYLPFLRIENYTQKSSDFRYIPEHLSKNKIINKDEIAIVRYGATAGFIARGLSGVLANNLFKLIVDDSKILNDYLFHYLRTNRVFAFFQSEMAGGAMPALSFAIVKNLKLNIPSLSEQAKIADFLTALDDKITQLTQKHKLLNQYKKGVMQKIFSQELRFKDDDGQSFPAWGSSTLEDVSINYHQGINTSSDKVEYVDGGIPIIQAKHITGEYLDFSDARGLNKSDYDKYKKKFNPKVNDLLISNIGTLGKVVLIETEINFLIAWNIFKVTLNTDRCYPKFIKYFLKKIASDGFFDSIKTGNATKFVNKSDMLAIEILMPCLREQTKIAKFLNAFDEKISAAQSQLALVKQYKQGLLQQMFV
jgi:type I restriction enzyme S subunit